MVLVPINTFKVGSPQVRIETAPNFLDDTATHEYIYVKNIDFYYTLPILNKDGIAINYLDNNYYNVYDSNVDGNGNPIYIRN